MYVQLYVQSFLKCGSVWTKRNRKNETKQKKRDSFQRDFFMWEDLGPFFCAARDMITYSQYGTLY